MFLNHKWERDEFKQQSGVEYFRFYNQQTCGKKYLKRDVKIRQLTGKYALNYQKETNQTKNWEIFLFFLTYFQKQGEFLPFFKNPP